MSRMSKQKMDEALKQLKTIYGPESNPISKENQTYECQGTNSFKC